MFSQKKKIDRFFTILYTFMQNFIKEYMSWLKNMDKKWWLRIL